MRKVLILLQILLLNTPQKYTLQFVCNCYCFFMFPNYSSTKPKANVALLNIKAFLVHIWRWTLYTNNTRIHKLTEKQSPMTLFLYFFSSFLFYIFFDYYLQQINDKKKYEKLQQRKMLRTISVTTCDPIRDNIKDN